MVESFEDYLTVLSFVSPGVDPKDKKDMHFIMPPPRKTVLDPCWVVGLYMTWTWTTIILYRVIDTQYHRDFDNRYIENVGDFPHFIIVQF